MRPAYSAALLCPLTLTLAVCSPVVPQGTFACSKDDLTACPSGWACQCRGKSCEWRCYSTEGGYCGDGTVDEGEDCEGQDLGGESCETQGFHGGALACFKNCKFNYQGCEGICGDGILTEGEVCDGIDFGGLTCTAFAPPPDVYSGPDAHYYAGHLTCSQDCQTIDAGACSDYCGDLVLNGSEYCDGADIASYFDCSRYGFYNGGLTCAPDCRHLDTSTCTGYCGDLRLTPSIEDCDGYAGDCAVNLGYIAGSIHCSGSCRQDLTTCATSVPEPLTWKRPTAPQALWASPSGWLIAVGDDGLITRFDGSTWHDQVSPTTATLTSVWGSSDTDIYAVGESGTIVHYDGALWTLTESPTQDNFTSVSGAAADDVFAATYDVNDSRAGLYHFDGMLWTSVDISALTPQRWSLWKSPSDPDLFLAGRYGSLAIFDGINWNVQHYGFSSFTAVHGVDRTQVVAVGKIMAVTNWQLARAFDGTSWTSLFSSARDGALSGVFVSSPHEIYAVGGHQMVPLLSRYDGESWFNLQTGLLNESYLAGITASPVHGFVAWGHKAHHWHGLPWSGRTLPVADLWHLAGLTRNDLYMAGDSSLYHFDGKSFTEEDLPALCTSSAIWVTPDGTAYSGGNGESILRRSPLTGTWEEMAHPAPSGCIDVTIYDIWGQSAVDVYAVGSAFCGSHSRAIALHYTPHAGWTLVDLPIDPEADSDLLAVWGFGPTVYAGGRRGGQWLLLFYDGNHWTEAPLPAGALSISELWGTSPANLLIASPDGIYHYDGSGLALVDATQVNSISGRSPFDIFAISDHGIRHFDGASWSRMATGPNLASGRAILALPGEAFALGAVQPESGTISTQLLSYAGVIPVMSADKCSPVIPVYCSPKGEAPARYFGDNVAGENRFESYGCAGSRPDTGKEVYYRFASPIDGTVTARLQPHEGDLDLIFVGSAAPPDGGVASPACDPTGHCLATSQHSGMAEEEIVLSVSKHQTYYLIVDGYDAGRSAYTLDLTCERQVVY